MRKGKFKPLINQRSILDFFTPFKNPSIVNGPLKQEIKQEIKREIYNEIKQEYPLENEFNSNEDLKNVLTEVPNSKNDNDSRNEYVNVEKLIYQLLNGRVVLKKLSPNFIKKLTNSSISEDIIRHTNKIQTDSEDRYYKITLNDNRIRKKLIKYCCSCNTTFENRWRHRTLCPNCAEPIVYKCMKCNREFKNRYLINYHWKYKCNPKRYLHCLKCNYVISNKKSMVKHVQQVHMESDKNLRCEHCNFRTRGTEYLTKHVRQKHRMVKVKVEKEL